MTFSELSAPSRRPTSTSTSRVLLVWTIAAALGAWAGVFAARSWDHHEGPFLGYFGQGPLSLLQLEERVETTLRDRILD